MICLSTSFRLHSGLSGNSLAGKTAFTYVNLFIPTYPLTFVFQRQNFLQGYSFHFPSSQYIILCGWHIFCCCNVVDDDEDEFDDDDDDDDDDNDDVTLTFSYCILMLSGPQYPAQRMVLQCMMGSCGYLLVMMGMLDSMTCGPSHCW